MDKKNYLLFLFLLFAGTYFPTSINGDILSSLSNLKLFLFIAIALFLLIKQNRINKFQLISFFAVILILSISTFMSQGEEYAFGSLFFIIGFFMMTSVNFKDIKINKIPKKTFLFFNFVTIFIGFSIIIGNSSVNDSLVKFYSNHKSFLVMSMVEAAKPVITFGSHSIAALFIFCLFFINYKYFKKIKKNINLAFSLIYLSFLFFLQSNTGFLFLIIGISLIAINALVDIKKRTIILFLFISFFISIIFGNQLFTFFQETYAQVQGKIASPVNGLLGRFGEENGVLRDNLAYIARNPFKPLGFSYNSDLTYTDSGLVEFALRGSVFLPLIIYTVFFRFLKGNLLSKYSAYLIFTIFIITDAIIYPILKFNTTFYIIPFMIIFLNSVDSYKKIEGSD